MFDKVKATLAAPEDRQTGITMLVIAALVVVGLNYVPVVGLYVAYPFRLLGTWFHEMGHGLTALLLGGKFEKLVIHWNGSGYASWSHYGNFSSFGSAMVAAGGPVGPAIAGSILIVLGRYAKLSRITLLVMAGFMLLSMLIWMRSTAGWTVIPALAALIGLTGWYATESVRRFAVQFLGAQACLSMFQDVDYLLSSGAHVSGVGHGMSDTMQMQKYLLLPYWFWGALLTVIAFSMMGAALWWAYRR